MTEMKKLNHSLLGGIQSQFTRSNCPIQTVFLLEFNLKARRVRGLPLLRVAQYQKVCQKVWLSSKSMPVYITLKKCSTQYVAHFMWLTKSLKIGEYATICSTLYVLPPPGSLTCPLQIVLFFPKIN